MPIESFGDGGMVITGNAINVFAFRSMMGRLRLEVNTGMRASGGVSTLKAVQRNFGVKSKTKRAALAEMEAMWAEMTKEMQ